ncbi:hypothetical protein LCGC14_1010070 [marine sediment metagenome]|uniref:Uncharacterized protein n=1 Tax=marine sediment metagenome TaxID=412755 RepID=A0A0F9R6M9_9ZZZZ
MQVSVEYVKRLKAELAKINEQPFGQIEWYECGRKITISAEKLAEWKLIGLNNVDFIVSEEYYKL